jgi:hypothetical protein
VARLGQALAVQQDLDELMASLAAYTGLRWGELAVRTAAQIGAAPRPSTTSRSSQVTATSAYGRDPDAGYIWNRPAVLASG